MSTRTIYTCDRCKSEQDTHTQFWNVGVYADHCHSGSTTHWPKQSIQVCRKCLDALGVIEKPADRAKEFPAAPTIEDMIREIVSNCVREST